MKKVILSALTLSLLTISSFASNIDDKGKNLDSNTPVHVEELKRDFIDLQLENTLLKEEMSFNAQMKLMLTKIKAEANIQAQAIAQSKIAASSNKK